MKTKNQSFSLEDKVIYQLGIFAKNEDISKSKAVNKILARFLNVEAKISLADSPYERKEPEPIPVMSEENRIAEWEWRKKKVLEGKFPTRMAEEYPRVNSAPGEVDIYLTPDGLPSDCSASLKNASPQSLTTTQD